MERPTEGQLAPDFTLLASGNLGSEESITLSALQGKRVVLFFYPKDDTPGCTVEACAFRDLSAEFAALDVVVLGISKDSVKSHEKFVSKFGLTFPLLADTETEISQAYGVWVQKMNYGKPYMGIDRTTFIIGSDGKITRIFAKVKPEGHAQEVLKYLKGE
jgi:thioredoxin-dependent peroxiredoxin